MNANKHAKRNYLACTSYKLTDFRNNNNFELLSSFYVLSYIYQVCDHYLMKTIVFFTTRWLRYFPPIYYIFKNLLILLKYSQTIFVNCKN